MGYPNATRQAGSNAYAALGAYINVLTGPGGTTGANEATGGGNSRQLTVWTPDGTGTNDGSEVSIPVAPDIYEETGVWSALSGGTFVGSDTFDGDVVVEVTGSGAFIDVTPRWEV